MASEIKALLSSRLLTPRLDPQAVDAYLAFGYVPPHCTIYENIRTLPPAHYLEWNGRDVRIERYWRPTLDSREIPLDEAAERLRELMQQAVRRQMIADVPVGAFLSGGHDSSTVVALMQQQTTLPVKTFSVGFGDYINELPYARAVAELYRTDHHAVDMGTPPVAELLVRMADVYDEPFMDPSHIPTYLISQFARQHVKVVLSGDGGDELFGGYGWYPAIAMSEEVPASVLKWVILRSLNKLLQRRISSLDRHSYAMGLAVRERDMWTRYINRRLTFKCQERRRLWGDRNDHPEPYFPGPYYDPPERVSGMNQAFYFDLMSFLPGDILVKVDRAAMANGLETRAPFLDRDLVEYALSLPAALKVKRQETKVVFKHAFKRYWPPQIHTRPKQGFAGPFQQWLGFADVQALANGVFAKGSPLRQLLPDQRNYRTWNLLTLGLWLERH